MSAEPTPVVHSTGRGGAGNVGVDATEYTDAGIVREGYAGESNEGEYSAGRGGAGNMVETPKVTGRTSEDRIPHESEVKPQEDFHTGRGGGGNVHKEKYGGHTHDPNKPNFIQKIKNIISGKKKEKKAETTTPETTTPAT